MWIFRFQQKNPSVVCLCVNVRNNQTSFDRANLNGLHASQIEVFKRRGTCTKYRDLRSEKNLSRKILRKAVLFSRRPKFVEVISPALPIITTIGLRMEPRDHDWIVLRTGIVKNCARDITMKIFDPEHTIESSHELNVSIGGYVSNLEPIFLTNFLFFH